MMCSPCAYAEMHGWWGPEMRRLAHCSDCHRTWGGYVECHCRGCHEQFGSPAAFTKHQTLKGCISVDDFGRLSSRTGKARLVSADGVWVTELRSPAAYSGGRHGAF